MCRAGSFRRLVGVLAVLGLAALGLTPAAAQSPSAKRPQQYALLVGCTVYPTAQLPELYGSANDVAAFAQLLTRRFGFADARITRLAGWPAEAAKRPTYKNIVAAFEGLIGKAGPGDQVVILLGGHGVEVPIPASRKQPLDPRNPKLDGTDKVFLPADVKSWEAEHLENALPDYQLRGWLDRLAAKGTAVWIILNCCHSGDMARGASPEGPTRVRTVSPADLKIPARAYADAARRAQAHAARAGTPAAPADGTPRHSMLTLSPRRSGKGSMVAFYACQPFESALEMPLPPGAAQVPANYHGLLDYYLLTALARPQKRRLTYRELGQVLIAAFQAERGTFGPTPFCEGDLDREVLGRKVWPQRSRILLEQVGNKLRVTAGGLDGLTPGSILAVHPPPDGALDPKEILGHVKVGAVTPGTAEVQPVAYGGKPAVARFPKLAHCTLRVRELGDMRLQVALGGAPAAGAVQRQRAACLAAALRQLSPDIRALLRVTTEPAKARWLLCLEGDRVQLRQGNGLTVRPPKADAPLDKARPLRHGRGRVVFASYPADDTKALAKALDRDLVKIFTWQNVWHVAAAARGESDENAPALACQLAELPGKGAPARPLAPGAALHPGQRIELRLKNEGYDDLWVTVLFLDANFGIQILFRDAIKGQKELRPVSGTISAESYGKEGFVVLAVPVKVQKNQPDFDFLEQLPLGRPAARSRGARGRAGADAAQTPFERLLAAVAFTAPSTRGVEEGAPTNPTALMRTWLTLPAPGAATGEKGP